MRRNRRENDALVLGLISAANRPVSAYDIAAMAVRAGHRLVPNQVYRTLARLIEARAVTRIEMLNAYLPFRADADICLICSQCHSVELLALPALGSTLSGLTAGMQFHLAAALVEAKGQCAQCLRPD